MNQPLNCIEANTTRGRSCDCSGCSNSSRNISSSSNSRSNRSSREYWYPLVEVFIEVVEVIVNSLSSVSISKSLIWTTKKKKNKKGELGKARILYSDASPLSYKDSIRWARPITKFMCLCPTLVTRRKTSFPISLTSSKV